MPPNPVDRIMDDLRRARDFTSWREMPSIPSTTPIYRPIALELHSPVRAFETVVDNGDGTMKIIDYSSYLRERTLTQDLSRPGIYFEDTKP